MSAHHISGVSSEISAGNPRATISPWALARVFLKISTLTPGGGMAMLPLLRQEFTLRRQCLTDDEMTDIIAVMHTLPGLIAINMAFLIGYRLRGLFAAILAALSAALPPFCVIVLLVWLGTRMPQTSGPMTDILARAFLGIRAGIAALILLSAIRMAKGLLTTPTARLLALGAVVIALSGCVSVIWVIVAGFVAGCVTYLYRLIAQRRASH